MRQMFTISAALLVCLSLSSCGGADEKGVSVSKGVEKIQSLMSAPRKQPIVSSLGATVTLANDTTLRVITEWGYKTAPPVFPDSTRVKVGLGASPPTTDRGHFIKWPQRVDTTFVPVSGYGTFQGYSCVVPHKGTTWATGTCKNWQFVRIEPPIPPYDTLSTKVAAIIVIPDGIQVDFDSNDMNGAGSCARWQANNPTRSPWIAVNDSAVPRCTGVNGKPTIAQFCAIYKLHDGRTGLTSNSINVQYCLDEYEEWASARDA